MLVRAYRLTDRLGVVVLKGGLALTETLLAGLGIIWSGVARVLGVLMGAGSFGLKRASSAASVAGTAAVKSSRKVSQSVNDSAATSMARRAARAEIVDVALAEDPLRKQNRVLSGLVVVLGVVVLGVILWATNPSRSTDTLLQPGPVVNLPSNSGGLNPVSPTTAAQPAASQPAVILAPTNSLQNSAATSVPTATPIPEILEVRGTLAYVVREKAQTDLWAIPVGSRSPLRLTNSPEDERDPAWSPDGRRLAYASRQDGNWELYIYELTSGQTTRLTYDLSFQGRPSWSPDGEWVAYESYQGNNLDIYVKRIDGSQTLRLTDHAEPDFSPAWSPDGRRIAFVSWREGNQDIYTFSLDDPRDAAVVNITNTAQRQEDYPAWSPDGTLLAYSALDEGLEKVFIKTVNDIDSPAQVLERGRTPSWSPDGSSLIIAVDSIDSTQLIVSPFTGTDITTEIIPVARGATMPVWSTAPLPQQLINSGGLGEAITEALFVEVSNDPVGDPPFKLATVDDVRAPNAVLSERVNDSFISLREGALETAGWDVIGRLEDAFWPIDRPPQPGEERRNWLMTGRSFAINRNDIVGFPAPLEVVREDIDVNTFWRVYVRVSEDAQSGQLGEPLRHMPWDFASRNQGDVDAYDQGGRLRTTMPPGYYIDFTQLAADYGWQRAAAGSDWRANFNSTNYWLFQKREGLDWYDAMRELYTEPQLGGFAPRRSTPIPPEAQAAITAQPALLPTATPVPPEQTAQATEESS